MHQLDRQRTDQRGLFGGLGDCCITRREGRCDRPDEDRQREIPRADAGEHAAPVEGQLVKLTSRSGKDGRLGELSPRFGRIIAQEIDRLANLKHRIDQCLARLADAQRKQLLLLMFKPVSGGIKQIRPRRAAKRIPPWLRL